MVSVRGAIRGVAVGVALIGFAALPSLASAQNNGPAEGPLTVEVVLTGDAGGVPGAVVFTVTRQSTGDTVLNGTGQATPQTSTLVAGSYLITPSVADSAYTITDTSCRSQAGQGPNRPDFIIDGTGAGGGGDATCVITVRYTAPPPTTTVPPATVPPATVPPTTNGDTTTMVPATTTVVAVTPTTTDEQGALPATGGIDSTSGGSLTGTMPATGPTGETPAIAITAIAMLMLGSGALALARRH